MAPAMGAIMRAATEGTELRHRGTPSNTVRNVATGVFACNRGNRRPNPFEQEGREGRKGSIRESFPLFPISLFNSVRTPSDLCYLRVLL